MRRWYLILWILFLLIMFLWWFIIKEGCSPKWKKSFCPPCEEKTAIHEPNIDFTFLFTGGVSQIDFEEGQVKSISVLKDKIVIDTEYNHLSLQNLKNVVWTYVKEKRDSFVNIIFFLPQWDMPLLNETINIIVFEKKDKVGEQQIPGIFKEVGSMECVYTPYTNSDKLYYKTLLNTYPNSTDNLRSESLYYEGKKYWNITSRCIIVGEKGYIIQMRSKDENVNTTTVKSFLI